MLEDTIREALKEEEFFKFIEIKTRESLAEKVSKVDEVRKISRKAQATRLLAELMQPFNDYFGLRDVEEPTIKMGYLEKIKRAKIGAALTSAYMGIGGLAVYGGIKFIQKGLESDQNILLLPGGAMILVGAVILSIAHMGIAIILMEDVRYSDGDIFVEKSGVNPFLYDLGHEYCHHLQSTKGFVKTDSAPLESAMRIAIEGQAEAITHTLMPQLYRNPGMTNLALKRSQELLYGCYMTCCELRGEEPAIKAEVIENYYPYKAGFGIMQFLESKKGRGIHREILSGGPETMVDILKEELKLGLS